MNTSKQNVSQHIQAIFEERELEPEVTVKKYLTVSQEGQRQVKRLLDYYNLDMIISVGYRVKSNVAIRFRQWANRHIKEFFSKPNLGRLTSWRGPKVRKQDVVIARNYLNEEDLPALNNLVEQYLVFAEGQAMRRIPMHMADWITKLDGFLRLIDRNILEHTGGISRQMAMEISPEPLVDRGGAD